MINEKLAQIETNVQRIMAKVGLQNLADVYMTNNTTVDSGRGDEEEKAISAADEDGNIQVTISLS